MLGFDSSGSAVRSVQEMLRTLGFRTRDHSKSPPVSEPLEADGIFGGKTESAVIDFQRSEGVLADGIVGPTTMEALQDAYSRRILELNSPGVDSTLGMPDQHTFERVPASPYEDGYHQLSLRNDVAEAYRKVYETVKKAGGLMTSSGGIRSIHTPASRSRSATSLHYLGRALDLYIYAGMVNPKTDPYVIRREGEREYRVYARCSKDNNSQATLPKKTSIKNCIDYGDRTVGQTVAADHFLDLTKLLSKHGFERIRARRRFEEGASMMGAEWWHFQYETGLIKGVSTFGHELLKVYSRNTVEGTAPWRFRDRVWKVNWS